MTTSPPLDAATDERHNNPPRVERFLVLALDKGFSAMRMVAPLEAIERQRCELEESQRYDAVIVTARIGAD